jgi:hypothetical protein
MSHLTEELFKKVCKKYVITTLLFKYKNFLVAFTCKKKWQKGKADFSQIEEGNDLNKILKKIIKTKYRFD